jgi:hypothetical protein
MHHDTIVPDHDFTGGPVMAVGECGPCGVRPQFVK